MFVEKIKTNTSVLMKVRALFVFYGGKPYIYTETEYEFACEGEILNLTAKTPEQLGWKRYSVSDTKESPTVNYYENDTLLLLKIFP